jgi:hypothetical protein
MMKNRLKKLAGLLRFRFTKRRVKRLGKNTLVAYLIVSTVLVGTGLIFLLIPYFTTKEVGAAWFNDNWSYRQTIAITNSGSAQTDFQVSFTMNTSTLISAGKMQSGCQDIRITDFNGKILPYWIEKGASATCNTTTTKIWTKLPSIGTTGNTIFVYYGNASASSGEDGKGTFIYFDDFNTNINNGLWGVTDATGTQITFSGGRMNFVTGNQTWGQAAYLTPSIARGETTFEADFLPSTTGHFMFGWKDDGAGVSYANLVYGYYEPAATTPQVYEDANARGSVTGTWTQGTQYKVRMRMRASGGNYYDQSTDGGINFTNSYTSTYSTESTLHPGFMLYSGTSHIDNFFVRKDATTPPSAAAPASEEKAPTAVGYWKFDEGTGTVARTSTSPGFSPKSISNLGLWLDASAPTSITLGTSGVSQWNDLSGNGRNFTQSTASQQPSYTQNAVNGKPAVTFTASASQTMTNSTNFGTPVTVIYMSRQTGGTNGRVLSGLSNNWLLGYHLTRRQQAFFNGWIIGNGTGPASTTNWYIYTGHTDGSTSSVYENGTLLASNSGGVAGPNGLALIGHLGTSEFSDAQIAEVIVYNKVLSTTERQRVEAYLAQKWGQGSTLNSANPFYNLNYTNTGDGILNNFASPPTSTSGWQTEDQCVSSKCLRFDGSDDYVDLGDPAGLQPTNISVGAWFKTTSTSGMMMVRKRLYGYGLQMGDNADAGVNPGAGKVSFWIVNSTPTYYAASSSQAYNDGKWHYAEGTYDGSNVRLYIDGKIVATTAAGTMHYTADAVTIGRDAGSASKYFSGTMDDVRIYNFARTAAQVATDYNSKSNSEGVSQQQGNNAQNMPAALSDGLVGYWKMDQSSWNGTTGQVTDSSGQANNGTSAGNATTATGKYYMGGTFDGTGDYVSIGSGKFDTISNGTIAFWINQNSSATDNAVFTHYVDGNNRFTAYYRGSTGKMMFDGCVASGSCTNIVASSTSLTLSTWTHVTVTFGANGMKIYLNGKLDGTSTSTANFTSIGTSTANDIGGISPLSGAWLNGKLDDLRIYNRNLSDDEISQLANWAPEPAGYWRMEESSWNGSTGDVKDSSGNSLNGTSTSGAQITLGKYGKGGNFDGTDDYISIGDVSGLSFERTQAFTIESWVKTTHNGIKTIFAKQAAPTTYRGYHFLKSTTNTLQFVMCNDNATNNCINLAGNQTINDGNWHHVAVSYSGSSTAAGVSMYVDGVKQTNTVTTDGLNATTVNTVAARIGTRESHDIPWNGSIDEVKVYNYTRTQGQIQEDLNAFHPAPGSPVSSSSGYWKFNEGADNMCSGGTNDACNSGSAGSTYDAAQSNMSVPATSTSGWTQSGKLSRALLFDGTDDIVTASGLPSDFFTGSWSQTLWIKTTQTGNKVLTEKGSNLAFIQTNSGQIRAGTTTTAGDYFDTTGSPLITDDNWHHIAVTYDGSSNALNIYIDGIRRGGGTTGNDVSSSATAYAIGSRIGSVAPFSGTIDEVKVFTSVLTADQIALDKNQASAESLGTLSSSQSVPNAAASEYCIPGDSSTCTSPVGRWDLEEGTGTTAYDKSGNANTGTITAGSGGYAPGKPGKGYNFDGSSTIINAGSGTSLDNLPANGMTAEAWYYPRSLGESSVGFILSKNTGLSQNQGWFLLNLGTNYLQFVVDGSTDLVVNTSNNSITLNRWNHIAVSWDGNITTASSVHIYVNGVETSYQTQTNGANRVDDAASSFTIGNDSTQGRTVDGIVDSVRLFNYARTPAQIAWDYNQGKPQAHWKLDDCQGTTANDSSGNSYSGTISIGGTGTYTTPGTCTASSASSAWYNGATGKRNYSLAFDGTDDYVSVGDMTITESASQVSWSVWVKPASLGINKQIFNKARSDLTQLSWAIGTDSSTSSSVKVNISTTTTDPSTYGVTPSGALSTGAWTHIVAVFDGTQSGNANRLKIYINGIPQTLTFSGTIPAATLATTSNATLAASADQGASLFFNGQIDDVSIYKYPLTATQVKTLYNSGVTRYGPVTGAP